LAQPVGCRDSEKEPAVRAAFPGRLSSHHSTKKNVDIRRDIRRKTSGERHQEKDIRRKTSEERNQEKDIRRKTSGERHQEQDIIEISISSRTSAHQPHYVRSRST
jgi:hypothetical protein